MNYGSAMGMTNASHAVFSDFAIKTFSIQKEGRYIVAVAEERLTNLVDVYLLDRSKPGAAAMNLTQEEYSQIPDAAISRNGDIVFINLSFIIPKNGKFIRGLYLIPFREIEKPRPKAKLLLEVDAYQVDWAPNGKEIVYETDWGIFHFEIRTKKISQITKDGTSPVFSPDGGKIAFLTSKNPMRIGIKTARRHNITYIEPKGRGLEDSADADNVKWSVDGQSIVYTVFNEPAYSTFVVPIDGGDAEQIFKTFFEGSLPLFEWTRTAYVVEPMNRLTTLWGTLKMNKTQSRYQR